MSPWSEQRVELIKARWGEGHSASQIARELGVTRNAVIGKLARLGLTGRPARKIADRAADKTAQRIGSAYRSPLPRHVRTTRAGRVLDAALRRRAFAAMAENIEATDLPADRSDFAVSFVDVTRGQCRWPLGDPAELANFLFCGAPQAIGRSYCARHAAMAYQRRRVAAATKDEVPHADATRAVCSLPHKGGGNVVAPSAPNRRCAA